MISSRWSALCTAGVMFAPPLFVLAGCARDESTSPVVPAIALARVAGGNGGGPTVKSADPDSASTNVTLDVRVLGSGYDPGSRAIWALNGDTALTLTKIRTNSTRYVSSREVVANITIAADAVAQLYDVVVVTAGGKKGIGIELFAVTVGASGGPYTAVLNDSATYKLRSDDGTMYAHLVRCVGSQRFAGGIYQVRTIANTVGCKAVQRPGWRWFSIDLGTGNPHDLDQDGTAEPIEHVPGWFSAADAFANGATSTAVRIFILKVDSLTGSTTQDPVWNLEYTAPAAVETRPNEGRVLTAAVGAVNVLKPVLVGRKIVWTSQGSATLPFQLTLVPQ